MIKVRFYRKPHKGSIHMTLEGHAGAAPKGEDLVCASATMLAYTAAQAVKFLDDTGKLKMKPKIEIAEGKAKVVATPTEEAYAETLCAFWTVQCGIHVLAHNYPQFVELEHLTM